MYHHLRHLVADHRETLRDGVVLLFGSVSEANLLVEAGARLVNLFLSELEGPVSSRQGDVIHPQSVRLFSSFGDVFDRDVLCEPIAGVVFSSTPFEWRWGGEGGGGLAREILSYVATALRDSAVTAIVGNGYTEGRVIEWRRETRPAPGLEPAGLMRSLVRRFPRLYRRIGAWGEDAPTGPLVELRSSGRLPTSGRAYDIGCGNGYNAAFLREQGLEVVGIDASETAMLAARHTHGGRGLRFLHGDVLDGALYDRPASFILDRGCFHCLPPQARSQYAQTVWDALEPGGLFLLIVFSEYALHHAQVSSFAKEDIQALFSPGFDIESVRYDTYAGCTRFGHVVLMRRKALARKPTWLSGDALFRVGINAPRGVVVCHEQHHRPYVRRLPARLRFPLVHAAVARGQRPASTGRTLKLVSNGATVHGRLMVNRSVAEVRALLPSIARAAEVERRAGAATPAESSVTWMTHTRSDGATYVYVRHELVDPHLADHVSDGWRRELERLAAE